MGTFVCHGAAMLAMAGWLAPMLPGGGMATDAERVARIAAHPWLFRLGWMPWHLTAVSDVLVAAALLLDRRVPRGWAWLSALLTASAVVPDQVGQLRWVTEGVRLAQSAVTSGDLGAYLALEQSAFALTAAWAAGLYTLGAMVWGTCLAQAGYGSRTLRRLGWTLWALFAAVSVAPLLPPSVRPAPALVALGNAVAFVGLELWLVLGAEQVMRANRPGSTLGRWAPWRAPWRGPWGSLLEVAANSHVVHSFFGWLPAPVFASDITDVIYVNYLVPVDRVRKLVPEGLELQVLGPGLTMVSMLTYQHGHFGPRMLGPLRRVFPSPVQTNWRLYVRDQHSGREGITFFTNAVSTTLHALGARLMTDGAPMHRIGHSRLDREPTSGRVTLVIDPAGGTAPDLLLDLAPTDDRTLRGVWASCFADYDAMLAYTVPQDRALATQPWRRTTSRDEISLDIPLTSCEPLAGEVTSRAAAAVVGEAVPLCFRVAKVDFVLAQEVVDHWG